MFYFFQTCKLEIDHEMATCLLTGIFTDTGGFKHANTTSDALAVASELMKKGARIEKISKNIMGKKKPGSIRIWARALENTRFDEQKMMVYSVLTEEDMKETGASDDDLSGFINLLTAIPQAKFAMLLRQDGNTVRGSLRSEPDRNVNVSKIAATFGGGGHALASGFKIKGRIVKMGRGWKIVSDVVE
jgi:phosphoesterase RecJ-like protein